MFRSGDWDPERKTLGQPKFTGDIILAPYLQTKTLLKAGHCYDWFPDKFAKFSEELFWKLTV